MKVRVFFQLASTHNLKREPIKIMDFEQSCPDMLYSLICIIGTHTHSHNKHRPCFLFHLGNSAS